MLYYQLIRRLEDRTQERAEREILFYGSYVWYFYFLLYRFMLKRQ